MYSDEYFDHLAACDNDSEVLRQFMRLAYLDLDERSLKRLLGCNQFNLRKLLATSFKSLENEEILGERGATFLKLLNILILRFQKTRILNRDVIANIHELYNYLMMTMSCMADEQIIILLLDSKNQLIRECKISGGVSNHIIIHPRKIIQKVVEHNASAFIIVHNHPSGDPHPSDGDLEVSTEIHQICKKLDIQFHDHVIVGREKVTSMRAIGVFDYRASHELAI
jgi:DNA repair protein RadC